MDAQSIVIITAAIASPILAMWNVYQGTKIKALEIKYNNLCSQCLYVFTPKNPLKADQI